MEESYDVLLVEDNPGDIRLFREAFEETRYADSLHVVTKGDEVLDFLHQRGDYGDATRPSLVLLDWSISDKPAVSILTDIREDPDLKRIPVIVLTGPQSSKSISQAYELHANAYIEKACSPEEILGMVQTLDEFWFSFARLPPLELEDDQDTVPSKSE